MITGLIIGLFVGVTIGFMTCAVFTKSAMDERDSIINQLRKSVKL